MDKNIILCGFMGCGKSTVGKTLAQDLNRKFIDTDEYIEKKLNMKISEIFDRHGEDYFRDFEHSVCKELSLEKNLVISAGGGALTFDRNAAALKESGVIVFLNTPLGIIKKRLENDSSRPLLNKKNKDEIIDSLFAKRYPIYKKNSDTVINTGVLSPKKVSKKIIDKLYEI